MEMVQRNPSLKVFAFHDCSPEGMILVHQLQTSDRWFKGRSVTIIDIGLHPRDILESIRKSTKTSFFIERFVASKHRAEQLVIAGQLVPEDFSSEEWEWLAKGYFVVLESFLPQTLIHILHKGIAESKQLNLEDESSNRFSLRLRPIGGTTWDYVDYGADSFG